MKLRMCFEVRAGLAYDLENGNPAPCGIQVELGEIPDSKYPGYEALTSGLDMADVVKSFGLDGSVNPNDVRVISPEEYDRLYG